MLYAETVIQSIPMIMGIVTIFAGSLWYLGRRLQEEEMYLALVSSRDYHSVEVVSILPNIFLERVRLDPEEIQQKEIARDLTFKFDFSDEDADNFFQDMKEIAEIRFNQWVNGIEKDVKAFPFFLNVPTLGSEKYAQTRKHVVA